MDERQKRIRYYTMPQNDTRKECRVASAQELIETVRLTVYNAVHMQVLEAHHEMARVRPDRAQRQWDWVAFGVAPLRGPTVDEFKHEKQELRRIKEEKNMEQSTMNRLLKNEIIDMSERLEGMPLQELPDMGWEQAPLIPAPRRASACGSRELDSAAERWGRWRCSSSAPTCRA